MHLAVGEPFPGHGILGEGVHMDLDTMMLVVAVSRPRPEEITAFGEGRIEVGVVVVPDTPSLLWFLLRANPLPWIDAPYARSILPDPPPLPPIEGEGRRLATIVLADTQTRCVRALRVVSFPPEIQAATAAALHAQVTAPPVRDYLTYARLQQSVATRFSTPALVALAQQIGCVAQAGT